ncbi:BspA family leucine-rich repeat surface protein [uncultured Tenacibaculum sp.]|uniref:BspA family leucine-rich repeat surface protein n=1 Tax=uncultured Tenacibaculum sp. TaxID=174713 RepID=UPI0026159347|nr:BspA family leucine-rich repeat surface protein [uncultured Tenacibaculum sp.]
MKKITILCFLMLGLVQFSSCSKDDAIVNTPPVIKSQSFSVKENINDTYIIGKVQATDVDKNTLSFSIKTDVSKLFEISSEGAISLISGKTLDYETTKTYMLEVEVSDGTAKTSATITINVTDIDENTAPTINSQSFTVAENINDTVEIGTIVATDGENDSLSFSIKTNDNGLFEITSDGKLSLVNGKSLDYETTTSHTITIEVTDGKLTANNTITITVTDVNEIPGGKPFITTWETTSSNQKIIINTGQGGDATKPNNNNTTSAGKNSTSTFTIDWGDGIIQSNLTQTVAHTYTSPGIYTVKITGYFPHMRFAGPNIRTVEQWGDQEWENMYSFFRNAENLVIKATDTPNLSKVTDMSYMFYKATNFNSNINNWDVSSVKNMNAMFNEAKAFNQDLNSWDVSKVTNMSEMFEKAKTFNQPLNNWDVSKVTNMSEMFKNAENFDKNISNWNTNNVTNLKSMFEKAKTFNQPLNNWDVSKVIDMSRLLSQTKFDQPLNNWDVSKVTNMQFMFSGTPFNQDINSWDVSSVSNMAWMFSGCKFFNGNITSWNTNNVTTMASMFAGALQFNQNISNWNTSKVTSLNSTFNNARRFNQPIGKWDTSKVTTFNNVFYTANSLNQDLSNWTLESVPNNTIIRSFLSRNSAINMGKTLQGWANNNKTPSGITFSHSNSGYKWQYCSKYTSSVNKLINDKGWTFLSSHEAVSCP